MNSVDVIVLIFVGISVFLAAKRGLVLSLLNLGAVVLAGILSRGLAPYASEFFYNTFLHEKILSRMYEILPEGSVSGQVSAGVDRILSELPTSLIAIAKQYGLYPKLSADTQFLTVEGMETDYVIPLVTGILSIIATVLLFIVFLMILKIIAGLINRALTNKKKHKIVHKTNAIAGALIGVVKAVIPVGIICIVLNLVAPASGNTAVQNLINGSLFCSLVAKLIG